ncbi:hypothetical protein VNO77_27609 [Canavalia gladiata]|uniref:Uncharacterized protein n=1 Tax=Canavalia gladiata TaxID=3824 RepID=A0AAN9KUB7_CANGL
MLFKNGKIPSKVDNLFQVLNVGFIKTKDAGSPTRLLPHSGVSHASVVVSMHLKPRHRHGLSPWKSKVDPKWRSVLTGHHGQAESLVSGSALMPKAVSQRAQTRTCLVESNGLNMLFGLEPATKIHHLLRPSNTRSRLGSAKVRLNPDFLLTCAWTKDDACMGQVHEVETVGSVKECKSIYY